MHRGSPSAFRAQVLVRLGVAAGLAMVLCGCGSPILEPKGPIGVAERTILIDSLAIMLAIVIPTIAATLGFAWWFRASNKRSRYLPDWSFSGQLELVVWSIPAMVIILLGGVTWIGSHELDPANPLGTPATEVPIEVVSLDWKWLFIYPDQHVATVNQLVVPAGVPLHFSLTSASVMNAFFVPDLGSMIYTMNGMTTQLNLEASKTGSYHGFSSHFSGDGFSDMQFEVRVVPIEEFAEWARSNRGQGPTLNDAAYTELAKQSAKLAPATFGEIDADLFSRIVSQKLAPGPGPDVVPAAPARPIPMEH